MDQASIALYRCLYFIRELYIGLLEIFQFRYIEYNSGKLWFSELSEPHIRFILCMFKQIFAIFQVTYIRGSWVVKWDPFVRLCDSHWAGEVELVCWMGKHNLVLCGLYEWPLEVCGQILNFKYAKAFDCTIFFSLLVYKQCRLT